MNQEREREGGWYGQIAEASREEKSGKRYGGSALSRSSARNPPSHSEFPCRRLRARDSCRGLPSGTAELRRRIITFYADFNTRLRPTSSLLSPPLRSSCTKSHPVAPSWDFESLILRYHPATLSFPNDVEFSFFSTFYVVPLFSRPAPVCALITETRFLRRSMERTNERTLSDADK